MNPCILLMGFNHVTAPLQVREQAACTQEDLLPSLSRLLSSGANPLAEGVVLSTCNRMEIYAVTEDRLRGEKKIQEYFAAHSRIPIEQLTAHLYAVSGRNAAIHLFSVASGLDSMILGEFEILGQVRTALEMAVQQKTVGPLLSALFQTAIHTGKRARSETGIGRGAASAAYAAIQLAREKVGPLKGRCVLIIGAGEMGQRVAKNMQGDGVGALIVANRTHDHALDLAGQLKGRAVLFADLNRALVQADVVISTTGAPQVILDAAQIAGAMAERASRPLCVIDIALPRDIDPRANEIPNVHLFDLDDLQSVARWNLAEREKEVEQVQAIVAQEAENFWRWYLARRAVPVIAELRRRAEFIRAAEFERTLRRLGHLNLSERDRSIVAALSTRIVNKLLAAPTAHLKESMQTEDKEVYLDTLRELFELREKNENK